MALRWNGDGAMQAMRYGAVKGLNKGAELLLTESKLRVPVDTTDLRKSGSVHQATLDELQAKVVYSTPYAVAQHERLDYVHPTVRNPGAQAKYLERPAIELGHKIGAMIALTIQREMRS